MKSKSLLASFALALSCQVATAAVIPVSEDTYAAPSDKIGKAAGKENFLQIAGDGAALLRFDVADYAGLIQASSVSSARVVFHFSKVKKASDLKILAVTSEWAEAAKGRRPAPSLAATPLSTIPAAAVIEDQFAIIDVTDLVKQWLTTPASDFGLALAGGAGANIQIASKEGPLFGHPAWLEIESHPVTVSGNDQIAAGVDAAKLGNGTVSNAELSFLDGTSSPLQTQLNALTTSLNTLTASLGEAVATAAGAIAGKVSKSGDTMTGNLDVKANVRLGEASEYFAASGEENLRFLRGTLIWNGSTMIPKDGQGFTVSHVRNQHYRINFTRPFAGRPTVTASYGYRALANGDTNLVPLGVDETTTTTTGTTLIGGLQQEGATLHFIVVGPR